MPRDKAKAQHQLRSLKPKLPTLILHNSTHNFQTIINQRNVSLPSKQRTYKARKDEITTLHNTISQLQAQLKELQEQKKISITNSLEEISKYIKPEQMSNYLIEQQIQNAKLQALVRQQKHFLPWSPLCRDIRLPSDENDRKEMFESVKTPLVLQAYRYLQDVSQYLDETRPYTSTEMYKDANGNSCVSVFDISQIKLSMYPNLTVPKIFETLNYLIQHVEMNVSGQFGQIAIREDFDIHDTSGDLHYFRILSFPDMLSKKLEIRVLKSSCFGQKQHILPPDLLQDDDGTDEIGIIAGSHIENDPMHPYDPDTTFLIEITPRLIITASNQNTSEQNTTSQKDDNLVIMKRELRMRMRKPSEEISVKVEMQIMELFQSYMAYMKTLVIQTLDLSIKPDTE